MRLAYQNKYMLVIGSLTINFFQMQIDWIDEQNNSGGIKI